jgi:predicted N-acetyltransferase YhbS
MAEGKTANEDSNTCEDGIEEIERPDRADADEVEERAFHPQVSERLVQALKDSIRATLLMCFVWHNSLV